MEDVDGYTHSLRWSVVDGDLYEISVDGVGNDNNIESVRSSHAI